MKTIEVIEKEQVVNLGFSKKEVLSDPDERKKRMADLYRSQTLGNLLQATVKLTFEASNSQIYQVQTTVWSVGADFISLKGGITLPINSILKVE